MPVGLCRITTLCRVKRFAAHPLPLARWRCSAPPQRLQRFSTYGHLKQMVLKMIVDEIATPEGDGKPAAKKLTPLGIEGVSPTLIAGLTVRRCCCILLVA